MLNHETLFLFKAEQKAQRQAKIEENRRLTNQKQQPDNPLPTNSPNDQNLLLLTNLSDLLPASSIASTVTNNEEQRTVLSNEDLQRVENIQSSYEQRIEIGEFYLKFCQRSSCSSLPQRVLFSCSRWFTMESRSSC